MPSLEQGFGAGLQRYLGGQMGAENPKQLWIDLVSSAKDFIGQFQPDPNLSPLENTAKFGSNVLRGGISAATSPFTSTAGLLRDFGRDVLGEPGGYWDKTKIRVERYGPLTAAGLQAAEGVGRGAAAATAGAIGGSVYNAFERAGSPLGAYIEPVQQARLNDLNTSTEELLRDHSDYHKQLGTSGEIPHMSKYHDDLARRVASDLGLPEPVLEEDFANLFDSAMQRYPDSAIGRLPHAKGPWRGSGSEIEQTPGQQMATYRWTQKKAFNVSDQWDAYKEAAIKDLRQSGLDEETVKAIRATPVPKDVEGFSSRLLKVKGLPDDAPEILNAWQKEVGIARESFRVLKSGGELTPGVPSPALEMQTSIFTSAHPSNINGSVAKVLRETAELYSERGDIGRTTAYNRAADIITKKGAPNLINVLQKGGLQEAFRGQGGIGTQMAKHIEDIISEGTFDELEALRMRTPGPGAAPAEQLSKSPKKSTYSAETERKAAIDYALRFKEAPETVKRPLLPTRLP